VEAAGSKPCQGAITLARAGAIPYVIVFTPLPAFNGSLKRKSIKQELVLMPTTLYIATFLTV
jgi:hypothetical protein